MENDSFTTLVNKFLIFEVQCRHCESPTSFQTLLQEHDKIIGAYCCQRGFVSRVIYFSPKIDLDWFHNFLIDQLGKEIVERHDLRVASRYGWELDKESTKYIEQFTSKQKNFVIGEVYWSRYPKSEVEKKIGVFLCSDSLHRKGCRRLFIQNIISDEKLCPQCR